MAFDTAFRDEFEALLRLRRDVRRFRPDPVDPALVARLIDLARYAPSVGLSEPWRFVSIEGAKARAEVLASFQRCNAEALADYSGARRALYARLKLEGLREAPVQFAAFADSAPEKGAGLGRRTMPETRAYSVVMAIHTIWLAARAEGLGLGWVSILEPEAVHAAAGAPENWQFIAYLCLGWPEEEADRPALERAGWERRTGRVPVRVVD